MATLVTSLLPTWNSPSLRPEISRMAIALAVVMADDELSPLPSGTVPSTRMRMSAGPGFGVEMLRLRVLTRWARMPFVPAIKYEDQWCFSGRARSSPLPAKSTSNAVGEYFSSVLRRTMTVLPGLEGLGMSSFAAAAAASSVRGSVEKAIRTSRSMAAGRTLNPQ